MQSMRTQLMAYSRRKTAAHRNNARLPRQRRDQLVELPS
jgi:hypothetical protein